MLVFKFFKLNDNITCRNNALIQNFRGGFRWQIIFKKIGKNKKKSDRKTGFFTQCSFRQNRFLCMVYASTLEKKNKVVDETGSTEANS
ncbi:Uncharacterized protein FWK35_00000758 [Aphis craccivora]|uniref:Uncharacterized protein n=1 Tax=Aphis craccivora TaxID=307492 RepID=A0A6G0Z6A7_APHCR|nr:Uncharacterized protein FWK35_00000758 [Aphis craccivora]